ncbi:MAG TPA: HD domain-containing protein [Vicinamibacterales bacterium]|nr:HD domain-containing protein [Vicinamibacterales bacterium]
MSFIDTGSARERLTGDGGAAGPTFVPDPVDTSRGRLTGLLTTARRDYVRAARSGNGGRDAQARYAGQMDAIVRVLVDAAAAVTPGRVAVCALGGYGRRALCLHSDVDLLIVFDGAIGPEQERLVKAVLQPLWDLQLVVGNHVRELAELDALDGDNPEFTMALLDARFIAGDEALGAAVEAKAAHMDPSQRAHAVDALLTLVDQRYAECNGTIYQLEPDVKSAPGGLRDITASRYLRVLQPEAFEAERGRPVDALAEAEDFLLRVRSLVHVETGRDANVLTHDLQERVAEGLGFEGADPQRRVERLMGAYFRSARSTARGLARARRAVRPPAAAPVQRLVGRQFEIAADGIRFLDPQAAVAKPGLWLELFRLAVAHGTPVSEGALDEIELHAGSYTPDDFAGTEAERHQIRNLLYPRPGLYARLSEMHDCGLLNRIFPELEGIHGRVIRDFYHRYTVDEHTLLTIRGLEGLWNAPTPSRKRFGGLLQELRSPELLTLALLLHDIGKAEDVDHAQESVRLAATALDRLDIPQEARDTVEFLIRHHLEMSRVAFRRDLDDPQVVERFAHLVGTEELLKMLCLLTLVDVEAVSSTTLTPWKEELLWRLYVDTYNHLTLGYGDELVRHDPAGLAVVIAGRPEDITEAELTQFLSGLPRRYLALFGLASIYRHVRLARGIQPNEVHTVLENHDDVWELTIVTLDKPYLFSNVAGVLSYFGMDIHRGQAMTTPEGLVLDVFEFADAGSFLRQNPGATGEICRMLDRVVAGWVDVPTLLRGREGSVLYRRRTGNPATVHFDNEHSKKYSVLEIVADDAPGLLYRISRVVSELECDLDLALIGTEGRKAIDVLHVTKAGRKLVEAEQARLMESLERVLNASVAGEAADETR